jgi:hypothetical protein
VTLAGTTSTDVLDELGEVLMQSAALVKPTQTPPRPSCNDSAFSSADCQDRWRLYNEAGHKATAPLQLQIEDLTRLATDQRAQIKALSDQIQVDSIAALQAKFDSETAVLEAKAAAHAQGLQQGAGIGIGATLLLFALIFGIKRLTSRFTVAKKPQARPASA